jgi:hypothetical protein
LPSLSHHLPVTDEEEVETVVVVDVDVLTGVLAVVVVVFAVVAAVIAVAVVVVEVPQEARSIDAASSAHKVAQITLFFNFPYSS